MAKTSLAFWCEGMKTSSLPCLPKVVRRLTGGELCHPVVLSRPDGITAIVVGLAGG